MGIRKNIWSRIADVERQGTRTPLGRSGSPESLSRRSALIAGGAAAVATAVGLDTKVAVAAEPPVPTLSASHTLSGHAKAVNAVAFSPLTTSLYSVSDDQTIRRWDRDRGKLQSTLTGQSQIFCLAMRGDGRFFASGNTDGSVKIWDALNEKEIQTLRHHSDPVSCVAYSPDGNFFASGSWDDTIMVYGGQGKTEPRRLGGHSDHIESISFSPDSSVIASGSKDKTIKLWDVNGGAAKTTLVNDFPNPVEPAGPIFVVDFAPHGHILASGGTDRLLILWDTLSGHIIQTNWSIEYQRPLFVAFSPDGNTIAATGRRNDILILDANLKSKRRLVGHTGQVNALAFSKDSRLLASGGADQTVKIWDLPGM